MFDNAVFDNFRLSNIYKEYKESAVIDKILTTLVLKVQNIHF